MTLIITKYISQRQLKFNAQKLSVVFYGNLFLHGYKMPDLRYDPPVSSFL